MLKKLKILLHFAIDNGWRKDGPTLRIKKFATGEFHTWTDEEIAVFEGVWKPGTNGADLAEGGIWVVQQKTKAKLLVPVHSNLDAAFAAVEVTEGTILKAGPGEAFTAKGFSNFMAERIDQAELPERCVTHGLRKAAAGRLAEAGCSANEIASITGHVTPEEVARYTKAAAQKKLARAAIGRLNIGKDVSGIPNLGERFGTNAEKDNGIKQEFDFWRPVGESNPCFQRERLTS